MDELHDGMKTENMLRRNVQKQARKKRIRRIVALVVVLALVVLFLQLRSFYKQNGHWPWQESAASSSRVQEVEAKVTENTYTTTIDLSGYVQPVDTQKVILRTTGTITKVFVKEGDRVSEGDSLVAADDTVQQYDVARLKAELEEARISKSSRDVELLEMQLKTALNKLDYTQAYANFDGVVASVAVEEGDYFEAGSTAMTLVDRSKLKATVEIDEMDMQYVHLGQKAELTFDSYPGEMIDAVVSYIPMLGRYTDKGIGVMDVELTIDDPPSRIAPGFTFKGTIVSEGKVSLVLLPQSAVTTLHGTSTVIRKLDDGTTETVEVTVKYLGEGLCQLLSGDLGVGDTLIVRKTNTDASSLVSVGI